MSGFVIQRLVELKVTWRRNGGDGVYARQPLALRATSGSLPPATLSNIITMEQASLPIRLEVRGPAEGAAEVRGVPFTAQPVVRVVGIFDESYADVTGVVQLEAYGSCSPSLSGETEASLVDGVATFTDVGIPTITCLGQPVAFRASVKLSGGGTVGNMALLPVSSDIFRITPGVPHRVVFTDPKVSTPRARLSAPPPRSSLHRSPPTHSLVRLAPHVCSGGHQPRRWHRVPAGVHTRRGHS